MYKFILVIACATVVLCQEHLQQFEHEEEVILPVEHLPPGTLVRVRRQFFGGVSQLPNGGFNQQAGYRGSVFQSPTKDLSAWGSLSQNFNRQGLSSPITYSGGTDFKTSQGHGLSASALHIPNQGSQATLGGQLGLINTPNHNLNAFASHTKTFDTKFQEIGKGSSTAGLGYQHGSGAALGISGTRTPGAPDTGSLTSSIPLHQGPTSSVNLNTQSSFAQGQKPNHYVGITATKTF